MAARKRKTSIASKIAKNSTSKRKDSYLKRGMYTSMTIDGFRQFEKLKLENLSRINLFFGANNSGKTSLLEAIFTHACGLNFAPFAQILTRRHENIVAGPMDYGEQIISLFLDRTSPPYAFTITARVDSDSLIHKLHATFTPTSTIADLDPRELGQYSRQIHTDAADPIYGSEGLLQTRKRHHLGNRNEISDISIGQWSANFDGSPSVETDVRFPPTYSQLMPPFKYGHIDDILTHRSMGADLKIFSALKRYGVLDDFTEEIKLAFPMVRGFDLIPYSDGTAGPVYVVDEHGRLPLYSSGDGMRRWFHILGNMIVFQNACHCIEEVEATLHPDAQRHFSRHLVDYTQEFNSQVFLTSHSIEFADNFLTAIYGEGADEVARDFDPVRIFTLKPRHEGKQPEIWSLTGREAYKNRRDFALELR